MSTAAPVAAAAAPAATAPVINRSYWDNFQLGGIPAIYSSIKKTASSGLSSVSSKFSSVGPGLSSIGSKFKSSSTDSILIFIAIPLIFISIFGNIAAITTIGNKDTWNENTKNMIITLSVLTFGLISYTSFICWYFNNNPHSNMYLIAATSLALFLSILAISFATINS